MLGGFLIIMVLLIFGGTILYKVRIREKRLKKFKEKYPIETATYIKYDRPSVKKYIVCSIVMGVLVLQAVIFMNIGVIYLEISMGFAIILILLGLFLGIPMFLCFLYHMLASMAYLKRLEKYGYEMPRDREIYENVLERLPKKEGLVQSEQPTYSKTSKVLFMICICVALIMLGGTGYYIAKWHFMGEEAISMLVIQLIGDVFWVLPAWIFYKQTDTKKYKDDVEIDSSRKSRFNMVSGVTVIMVLGCIAFGIKYTAHTMTGYVYSSQILQQERTTGPLSDGAWD